MITKIKHALFESHFVADAQKYTKLLVATNLLLVVSISYNSIVTQKNQTITSGDVQRITTNSIETTVGQDNVSSPSVLAATDEAILPTVSKFTFTVNVPSKFSESVTFLKDIVAPNIVESVNDQTGNVNISLSAGNGISIDGFKITNTGITSLSAGDGISIDGNKITNSRSSPDYTLSGWTKSGTTVALTTTTDSVTVDSITFGDGLITNGKTLRPNTDLGSDLGTSSYRFNNLYVANINSNSSQSFSGQTTFSYAPTSALLAQASVLINPTTSASNGQLLGLSIAGYQKALIDEDGDLIIGYSDATSAPETDYPLNIYGHSGTRISFVDTSGNAYFAGSLGIGTTSPTSKLHLTGAVTGKALAIFDETGNQNILTASASGTTRMSLSNAGVMTFGTGGNITFAGERTTKINLYSGLTPFSIGLNGNGIFLDTQPSESITFLWDSVEKIRFASGGNVGLGTTSPTSKLHVTGAITGKALAIFDETGNQNILTASASGTTRMVLTNAGRMGLGTVSPTAPIHAYASDALLLHLQRSSASTARIDIQGTTVTMLGSESTTGQSIFGGTSGYASVFGTQSNYPVQFATNNSARLTILGGGNVGIGKTDPDTKLDVWGGTSRFCMSQSDQCISIVTAADYTQRIDVGYGLQFRTGTANNTNSTGFVVANSTGSTTYFKVDKDGNVGIGISGTPAEKLEVSGNIKTSSLTTGAVYSNSGVLTNTDPSDQSLKDNIISIEDDALNKILSLNPVSFVWKETGQSALGFIAQEVSLVLPELVGINQDGKLGLYTTQFIPLLTKAIQAQNKLFEDFKLLVLSKFSQLEQSLTTKTTYQEKLCVGDGQSYTCLNKEQVDTLLQNIGVDTDTTNSSETNSEVLGQDSQIPESTPSAQTN